MVYVAGDSYTVFFSVRDGKMFAGYTAVADLGMYCALLPFFKITCF